MYLIQKLEGEEARKKAAEQPPFGPGFEDSIVQKTERVEVWGTSFKDPGPDYCLFKAFDALGQMVGQFKLGGY